ncbi:hypothetical protein ACFVUS_31230 [Nocardia sp. NPDC058058]|uniref:hypothetical protein n=1 Tax=Nocardia sp. NPDC058058 TaxID=3346317 RepID=UPI0036DBD723
MTEDAVWRMRNWPRGLVTAVVVVLVGLVGIGLVSAPSIVTYYSGESVTARVRDCWLRNPDRPRYGYICAGTWTFGDGRSGAGLLDGVKGDHQSGQSVAVRVRGDRAVTYSPRWPAYLGLALAAVASLLAIAYRAARRRAGS